MPQKRIRRQPQRTCIACRRVGDKRGFVRLVRTPGGEIVIDPPSRVAGRGAYLCRHKACWMQALRQKRIGTALRTELSPEDWARIEAFAADLPENESEPIVSQTDE
ncbi:MAG: YlxR family protein [Chloroflexi bacterium]|nr:YlxR family protein [Chloroflexota bacterium]